MAFSTTMLSMTESQAISELAATLYDFLPGSGNPRLSFPIAADRVGVAAYWIPGSKLPALTGLLQDTFGRERSRFCPLIEEIVRQSMTWRQGKGNPLRRDEVEKLNGQLIRLDFKIPGLNDRGFLDGLAGSLKSDTNSKGLPTADALATLQQLLMQFGSLEPARRGIQFEDFLVRLFAAFGLAPRGSIRRSGEEIDGSFELEGTTYLFEAKWRSERMGMAELAVFSAKVARKAEWARGLFLSVSGFTDGGLNAFQDGQQTNIVCMDALDLYHVLSGKLDLRAVISKKARAAAETNRAFVPVRELFAGVT